MKCSKCGVENNAGVKFCINCGSSMGVFCPNCGTSNSAGAKFCVSCGSQFGVPVTAQSSVPPQSVVVMKPGTPGWIWAFFGMLLGILIIGGLIIGGILPFGAPATEQAASPLQPVSESPDASAEGFAEPGYCPETGGVILYWNAGFDCSNDSGDPGYRLRYGDGFQGLNTGHFDNRASSIHIPEGWSARLYENADMKGGSRCFNTSISNFEEAGDFENRNLPVNDNVTFMQVFRDGTCGQDLVAGAEPAPMPEEEVPPGDTGGAQPGDDAAGAQAGVCGCDCIQAMFPEFGAWEDEWGRYWDVPLDQFMDGYVLETGVAGEANNETGFIVFNNANGAFERILNEPDLVLEIIFWPNFVSTDPWPGWEDHKMDCNKNEDGNIKCEIKDQAQAIFNGAPPDVGRFDIDISKILTPAERETCIITGAGEEKVEWLGIAPVGDEQPRDCRDPLVSCPDTSDCVQSKETGLFYCQEQKLDTEPPTEAPSDSSSDGSSSSGGSSCDPICEPPSSP